VLEFLQQTASFMPHGHCFLWLPQILWLRVVSDSLIAAAYFSIPFALWVFVRRRRDLEFRSIFVLFASFILWCGLTHVMGVWVVWNPDYALEGVVKAITAAISVTTAVLLWKLIPKALELPSPQLLRRANDELKAEVSRRETAESELRGAYEQLRARVAELESFSYSVSHDLRAPLRAMDGFAAILRSQHAHALGPDGHALLERIGEAARHMGRSVDGLLSYVRLGQRELASHPVEMRVLAAAAAESARDQWPTVRFEMDELPAALGDAVTLQLVWNHLVGNAAKFSAQRPGARVRVGVERGSDGSITYFVADNGIGFDPAHAAKLFGVFQKLHADERFEGTGLGLAIVQRVIERHGGRVWAEGRPGEGATFRFTLGERA